MLEKNAATILAPTDSMASNDAADWPEQMLLETLLDSLDKNGNIAFAKESVRTSIEL